MTQWPSPQPDPPEERGETIDGLLPSLERIREMDRATLRQLRADVADWQGPLSGSFPATGGPEAGS